MLSHSLFIENIYVTQIQWSFDAGAIACVDFAPELYRPQVSKSHFLSLSLSISAGECIRTLVVVEMRAKERERERERVSWGNANRV
jgi:hypothetical protein